jgi:DNA-binding transcriptional LysR family regulator
MDLRHLLTFRTVVDKGSFSQAAEELEVSQPAVSFQIRSLEERLGHRLLDRSGRRVTVTEAGEVVYRYARRMIGLEAEMEREVGELGTRSACRAGWCWARPPGRASCCCRACWGPSARPIPTCG